MAKITREEVLKLAALSKIDILDTEIESILKQLQDVLSYAQRVREIAGGLPGEASIVAKAMPDMKSEAWDVKIASNKNVNVFREDVIQRTDCKEILDQAPESQDNFFVVPKIIENK